VVREVFVLATEQKSLTVKLTGDRCHEDKPQPLTTTEIIYGYLVGCQPRPNLLSGGFVGASLGFFVFLLFWPPCFITTSSERRNG
jgi:hypothetical protein